jgi:hypothetical protein
MASIDMNAFQVGCPYGMHTAGTAKAGDQVPHCLIGIPCKKHQIVIAIQGRSAVRDTGLAGPAQISRSQVVRSRIHCDQRIR